MDRFLEDQALEYYSYQKGRARDRKDGKSSKTLRTVLAESYQAFLREFNKPISRDSPVTLAEQRFPHTAYGQDKNSETFKKSFPSSYKRHFFKLVKNIIVPPGKGHAKINKKGSNLLMATGARQ